MEEFIPYEYITLWDEAREHIEKHRFGRAIEIYKYLILMYSERPEALEYACARLAEIYLTLREVDSAQEYIQRALRINQLKPEYHYILGIVYSLKNQWTPAVEHLDLALQHSPETAEYLRASGMAVFHTGERENGLWRLNKALRIQPDDVNILTDLAAVYLALGEFQLARKYSRLALDIEPDSGQAKGTLWMVDYVEHQAHMEED